MDLFPICSFVSVMTAWEIWPKPKNITKKPANWSPSTRPISIICSMFPPVSNLSFFPNEVALLLDADLQHILSRFHPFLSPNGMNHNGIALRLFPLTSIESLFLIVLFLRVCKIFPQFLCCAAEQKRYFHIPTFSTQSSMPKKIWRNSLAVPRNCHLPNRHIIGIRVLHSCSFPSVEFNGVCQISL